jgi:CRP-like cAMP-binding protein
MAGEGALSRRASAAGIADEPGNLLLAALSTESAQRLFPFLETVRLKLRQVLVLTGDRIEDVYFPIDALASSVVQLESGETLEVGIIGKEGFVGVNALLGEQISTMTVFVQAPGSAVKMKRTDFEHYVLASDSGFRRLLYRYANALLSIVARGAACNTAHSASQRLARWLLMAQDRIDSSTLPLTQEFLSIMLGVRRATVTEAAQVLREAGAIRNGTGRVEVVNRDRLIEASCECYGAMNTQTDAVFRDLPV